MTKHPNFSGSAVSRTSHSFVQRRCYPDENGCAKRWAVNGSHWRKLLLASALQERTGVPDQFAHV